MGNLLILPPPPDLPRMGVDLRSRVGLAMLQRLDLAMAESSPDELRTRLREAAPVPPNPPDLLVGPVVLPGGSFGYWTGEHLLVPDTRGARVRGSDEAGTLSALMAGVKRVVTVSHEAAGLTARFGVPAARSWAAQSVSMLLTHHALHVELGMPEDTLGVALMWTPGGCVAWPLVVAPVSLAGATAGAVSLIDGRPVEPMLWAVEGREGRAELLSVALASLADEILTGVVSDRMRWAVADAFSEAENSAADQAADALLMLPAPFARPWHKPAGLQVLDAWPDAASHTLERGASAVMFGLLGCSSGEEALRWLRSAVQDAGAQIYWGSKILALHDHDTWLPTGPIDVPVACVGSLNGEVDPAALVEKVGRAATALRGVVAVGVPACGLYQRVDPIGETEAGTACSFGVCGPLCEAEV